MTAPGEAVPPSSPVPPSPSSTPSTVVVVTGMSGAGKSTALRALEDLAFYCVDNLPTQLIRETLDVCDRGGLKRVALGVDVRVRSFLDQVGGVLDGLASGRQHDLHVVFLDSSDEALLRRYSETRRPHPLSNIEQHGGTALAVLDGIRIERERLAPLRQRATVVIDTTQSSVHDLRRRIVETIVPAEKAPHMSTRFLSFGFKYGMPVEADVVFDVRFLDNPYFVPELRHLSGLTREVSDYVLLREDTQTFVDRARALLAFTLPRYEREGKSYLTVAIGCTGGRHRSVAITEKLAHDLRGDTGLPIQVVHRDVERASQHVERRGRTGGGGQ